MLRTILDAEVHYMEMKGLTGTSGEGDRLEVNLEVQVFCDQDPLVALVPGDCSQPALWGATL